jgi:hypothetical protein
MTLQQQELEKKLAQRQQSSSSADQPQFSGYSDQIYPQASNDFREFGDQSQAYFQLR